MHCVPVCRTLSALAAPSKTLHFKERGRGTNPKPCAHQCSLFLSWPAGIVSIVHTQSQALTPIQSVISTFLRARQAKRYPRLTSETFPPSEQFPGARTRPRSQAPERASRRPTGGITNFSLLFHPLYLPFVQRQPSCSLLIPLNWRSFCRVTVLGLRHPVAGSGHHLLTPIYFPNPSSARPPNISFSSFLHGYRLATAQFFLAQRARRIQNLGRKPRPLSLFLDSDPSLSDASTPIATLTLDSANPRKCRVSSPASGAKTQKRRLWVRPTSCRRRRFGTMPGPARRLNRRRSRN